MENKSLYELLNECDKLFVHEDRSVRLSTYDYTLGRFPYGWVFKVVNSWHKWGSLKTEFGAYERPEYAVMAFLDYVKENNIDVESLMDKS